MRHTIDSNGMQVIFEGMPRRVDLWVCKENVSFAYGVPLGREEVEEMVTALQGWLDRSAALFAADKKEKT